VLGVVLVIGIGLIWLGSRGALPREAEVAQADDSVHRVLVVANETVGGRTLLDELGRRTAGGPSEIYVVVPALTSSRLEHLAHDVDGAIAEARRRLDASLAAMRAAGLDARGEVGDHHDPNTAIEDALRGFAADEVIVSTHPPERSKWLESGVVERARSEIPLPVSHVVVDLQSEGAASPAP
jgi:GABA permease